jgi:HicA-like toxin of HicAB toxin-antitoxin system
VPTYRLRKVLRRLEEMGAVLDPQAGRKHATIRYRGRTARWPNPHNDPINDFLLSQILRQLGISRDEFFKRD